MSGYFEENRKFFGLNGVIGRRDFLINCIIIDLIECIFYVTPFLYVMLFNPELAQAFKLGTNYLWHTVAIIICGLVSSCFYFQNIVRRVRDIIGEEDDNRIYLVSTILSVLIFMSYAIQAKYPSFAYSWVFMCIWLVLLFWKGKITGEKPANDIIKFNWGAFLGTWLWGLFNKTPITLLMLPISLTLGGFPFMLICGLKGNEWAYKNKNCDDVEKFHKSQSNQSIIFLVIMPIISIIIALIMLFAGAIGAYSYVHKHPEYKAKMETYLKNYQIQTVKMNFDKIENTDGVYKFYFNPEDWTDMPDFAKKMLFQDAVKYVLIKNDKSYVSQEDWIKSIDLINKVKIYSTFNNEILAEFYTNPIEIEKLFIDRKSTTEAMDKYLNSWKEAHKFNQHPTLP
ncbi:hypothetical protein IJ541_11730 [bacterium]|nr:hypothetical protein [bacterium]